MAKQASKQARVSSGPSPRRPKARHYTMEWDVGDGYRPMTFDARSLTLPSVAILGIVGAFVWGTYIIVGERNRIDTRIDKAITAIERLADTVERSARGAELLTQDRYTRTEHLTYHVLFCSSAERLNKEWKCPPLQESQPPQLAPRASIPTETRREIESILRAPKQQGAQ